MLLLVSQCSSFVQNMNLYCSQLRKNINSDDSFKIFVLGADIEQPTPSTNEESLGSPAVPEATAAPSRGKVNEIDFCIAPADVSLSRSYSSSSVDAKNGKAIVPPDDSAPILSLTRALNNASNRAVRRILLARAWPSAEALNKSFRRAAAMEKEREKAMALGKDGTNKSGAKCPVPRPILNLIMRRKSEPSYDPSRTLDAKLSKEGKPSPRSRTDAEYVADQLKSFRERYGSLPGYSYAEAYLESILSLATSGEESPKVKEVSRFLGLR